MVHQEGVEQRTSGTYNPFPKQCVLTSKLPSSSSFAGESPEAGCRSQLVLFESPPFVVGSGRVPEMFRSGSERKRERERETSVILNSNPPPLSS